MTHQVDRDTTIFTHDEAVSLINHAVHPNNNHTHQIKDIGVIVGVLDMNHEVEVIVKFQSCVKQFTKLELFTKFTIEC
ncbi:hypothetical protein CWI80_08060 [Pseudidiomarina sediminum]|uniref:Uncharacterized protein n=1 Tax=Pseudidiomarina sediminum TaxID=431675 RepID=A0A432Z3N3_9GAMM|nr:hypothetical protein [Pseudidiomarina sediminum]RUO72496.1 hypothetical protein CWI80_08060 [Pseudidiomarina sediminum]